MNTTKARMYRDDYAQVQRWSTGTITVAEVLHALVKQEQNRRLRQQYQVVCEKWGQKQGSYKK